MTVPITENSNMIGCSQYTQIAALVMA